MISRSAGSSRIRSAISDGGIRTAPAMASGSWLQESGWTTSRNIASPLSTFRFAAAASIRRSSTVIAPFLFSGPLLARQLLLTKAGDVLGLDQPKEDAVGRRDHRRWH